MPDIHVTILTRTTRDDEEIFRTEIVRVFESTDACEAYILRLVRTNQMGELVGLAMTSHMIYGGPQGRSNLYVRGADSAKISDLTGVEASRG